LGRRCPLHIFFGFIVVILMAFFICDEQPAMSFCDIDDFADVISCMAIVLFSPSVIFMTAASALANPSSVQFPAFDLANTGDDATTTAATKAALNDLEIMSALHEGIIACFRNAPCQVKFLFVRIAQHDRPSRPAA
jgi:hypothetical protein